MIIGRLELKNFRNYANLSWRPHPYINILSGNNAQGKTNLLEAIFFCTAGRSFRTSREREMIGWTAESCYAAAEIEKGESAFEISVCLSHGGRTHFRLNGQKKNRGKIFRPGLSVSFTPADLDLVGGSPSERRKWLDLELGPFDFRYLPSLDKFEKVLSQRNNLLRSGARQGKIIELIEPWNEQMFLYGSSIIMFRMRLLKALFPRLREVFSVLTSGKEEITFNYISSLPLEKGMGPADLRGLYEETARKNFGREVERQQTLFGPHRDDLAFFINGSDVRRFGSRGQQRSVVLALKISLMRLFFEEYGEYPVLLLDDVFLELDRQRQRGLEFILGEEAQVFITSERRLDGCFGGRSRTYTVDGGKINRGEE
ncbi:MAG: DNA replication/repair protein RecF [Peptococcaceae bacterium]|nr:DNA replication/repair protein RecF [Peptococcaceae bacterium]